MTCDCGKPIDIDEREGARVWVHAKTRNRQCDGKELRWARPAPPKTRDRLPRTPWGMPGPTPGSQA
jgi:hypothetical protein